MNALERYAAKRFFVEKLAAYPQAGGGVPKVPGAAAGAAPTLGSIGAGIKALKKTSPQGAWPVPKIKPTGAPGVPGVSRPHTWREQSAKTNTRLRSARTAAGVNPSKGHPGGIMGYFKNPPPGSKSSVDRRIQPAASRGPVFPSPRRPAPGSLITNKREVSLPTPR